MSLNNILSSLSSGTSLKRQLVVSDAPSKAARGKGVIAKGKSDLDFFGEEPNDPTAKKKRTEVHRFRGSMLFTIIILEFVR